ncbi:hypothetical protein LTR50_003203 [Elasticomyces elasticus]|nr:hypothetical protein LTR50_003203 [Elasticomyces elasticus]
MRPIYLVLRGACYSLIDLLSRDTVVRFEDHLFAILRNTKSLEDQPLSLCCLGVMKLMAGRDVRSNSTSPNHPTSARAVATLSPTLIPQGWTSSACQQFFASSKAHKTMHLVTLRVIWAYKASPEISHEEASATVTLAVEICQAVEATLRHSWAQSNAAIVRKLLEKISASDISPEFQLDGLAFLGLLLDLHADTLGKSVPVFCDVLMRLIGSDSLAGVNKSSLNHSFAQYAPKVDQNWWHSFSDRLLRNVVNLSSEDIKIIDVLREISGKLVDFAANSQSLRHGVLSTLRDAVIPGSSTSDFLRAQTYGHKQYYRSLPLTACVGALNTARSKLSLACCSLLIISSVTGNRNGMELSPFLVQSVLDKYAELAATSVPCHHSSLHKQMNSAPMAFLEQQNTPEDPENRLSWRDRLGTALRSEAQLQHKAVLRAVADICHDLEQRCEDVETPLRAERERLQTLQGQHDKVLQDFSDLEARLVDRDLRIASLTAERDQAIEDLQSQETEREALFTRVEQLESQLRDTNKNADEVLIAMRRAKDDQRLEFLSTIACKEDALDELARKVDQMSDEAQKAKQDSDKVRTELTKTKERNATLGREVHGLNEMVATNRTEIARLNDQKTQSGLTEDALQTRITFLQNDCDRERHEKESLQAEMERSIKLGKDQLAAAVAQRASLLLRLTEEHQAKTTDFEVRIAELTAELRESRRRHDEETNQKSIAINELRQNADRLACSLSGKQKQLREAEDMRARLMSAMGLADGTSNKNQNTTPHTSPGDAQSPSVYADYSLASNTPSPRSQTPKHANPHKSLDLLSTQKPRTSLAGLRVKSAAKRKPLSNLSTNHSPRRRTLGSPNKVSFKSIAKSQGYKNRIGTADQMAIAELSFNEQSMLTSTPTSPRAASMQLQDVSGRTTTEL